METMQTDLPSRDKWLVRSRGWIAILLLLPFAAATLLSPPIVQEDSLPDFLCTAVAWLTFASGVAFRWWATLHVGCRKNDALVATGPYSLCRNPLYLGTLLITLAIAFYLESVTFAVGLVVVSLFYLGVTVGDEERRLRERFGDDYDRYCREVPRFVPRFRRPDSPPWIDVSVWGLSNEFHRAARYLWVPVLATTITHLRMETWWPHWWLLP